MPFTWKRLQDEVGRWAQKNFPGAPAHHPVLGLIEELGELAHAHLKTAQGIRGSAEEHALAAKDAIADSVIYFMDVCARYGLVAEEVLRSKTPEEFQATFSIPPPRRQEIFYASKHLAAMADVLERSELEGRQVLTLRSSAKISALSYMSGLAAYCTQRGWSLQNIVDETWLKVRQRDWTKNKADGLVEETDLTATNSTATTVQKGKK